MLEVPPTGISISAQTQTSMTVSWNANPRASSYRVYRNGSLIASPTGTSVNVTGLTASTAYSYVVASYGATGEGPPSAAVIGSTQTAADTTPPTVPVIAATSISSTSLRVALTPSTDSGTGVRDYRLEYKTSAASTWTVAGANLLASQFPYDIGGLVPSTAYNTRCSATDNAGNTSAYSATSNATTPAGSSLTWTGGSATIQSVPLTVGVAADIDIASYVTGEIAIEALSGSVPGMAYSAETMRLSGTPTTASPTENDYEMSFRATDTPTAEQDWLDRISGPGVVWYHNFDSQSELDQFRWMNGHGGGNDPLANDDNSHNATWVPTGGADGGGYVQFLRPAVLVQEGSSATVDNLHWWRPFNPLNGASNGRGVDDPGASGTIPLSTFTPTNQGSQTARWSSTDNPQGGWYGHPDDQNSFYQGHDFYLQIRVMADPRRSTPGNPEIGKFTNITTTNAAHPNQQLVTYAGYWSGSASIGIDNVHNVYDGWGSTTPLASLGSGPIENPTSPRWAYSFGWDTLLYHVTPGHSDVQDTRFEVWAAHEGETTYTKIWDTTYMARYTLGTESYKVHRPGWNAFMLWIFHNGLAMSEFWQRYDQIIFSHDFIPCPQV